MLLNFLEVFLYCNAVLYDTYYSPPGTFYPFTAQVALKLRLWIWRQVQLRLRHQAWIRL